MVDHELPDRRHAILEAAFKHFVSYGFKRTTMGDIADAAGVSRPALYLLFKNKNDIFRAGFEMFVEQLLAAMKAVLDGDGDLPDRVADAVVAGMITPFRDIVDTPHGAELFDAKQALAEDLGDDWFARMQGLIGGAMELAVARGEIRLPDGADIAAVARLLVNGIEGIKHRTHLAEGSEQEMRLLVDLMLKPMMTDRSAVN
jgi:AcrR family transcriptional regulator